MRTRELAPGLTAAVAITAEEVEANVVAAEWEPQVDDLP